MRRAALVGLFLVASCGGGAKHTPCTGSACLNVAGTYAVTASSPPAGNSCKSITYDDNADANGSFQSPFEIDQNDSVLTLSFEGGGVAFQVTGTLFTDDTASFQQELPHITVTDGVDDFDYADDTSIQLTFTPGGAGMTVFGTMTDSLTANDSTNEVQGDGFCSLSASLNGSL